MLPYTYIFKCGIFFAVEFRWEELFYFHAETTPNNNGLWRTLDVCF